VSGWIKAEKNLTETIRFRRVVRKLRDISNALRGVTENSEAFAVTIVLGALMRFWVYADSHIRNDNTIDITLDEINEIVGVDGFAQALPAEWLQVIDAEHVQLPNFVEHNGSSEKLRRDNARRQAAYRHRHQSRNVTRDVTVTNASNDARPDQIRPEETRGESKNARAIDDETEHAEWEATAALYPPGAARVDWNAAEKAARQLVERGDATWEVLRGGVARYSAHCLATNRMVLNPLKFFTDTDRPWSQAWPIPPPKVVRTSVADRLTWKPDPDEERRAVEGH
jgi:hypothetical protein